VKEKKRTEIYCFRKLNIIRKSGAQGFHLNTDIPVPGTHRSVYFLGTRAYDPHSGFLLVFTNGTSPLYVTVPAGKREKECCPMSPRG